MFRFGLSHLHTICLHQNDGMSGESTIDGLDHFYSFESEEFKKRVTVISMAEFIEREVNQKGLVKLDQKGYERALQISAFCENMRRSKWTEIQFNFVNPMCLFSITAL
jgi:hypothetical protein